MKKEEKISVIITTFKRSDKLENAIKSVINQTYKNIEIIVVDDNANFPIERKNTKEIIKKYKNIKLILNKKNLGGALARNEGIYASKGKYIAFLDDDDEFINDKIEKQYSLFKKKERENENPGLIFCNVYGLNAKKCVKVIDGINVIYQQMMGCLAPTSFWFTSKEVLEKINYFEDTPCKQDSIVLLKILAKGYKIFKVDEGLIKFSIHESNVGISGHKISNIIGLNNYRNWCRKYYYLLNNEKLMRKVESNFSSQLITLYVINNMKKEAKIELKNIRKNKMVFSSYFIKSFFKIYFCSLYLFKIKYLNKLFFKTIIIKIFDNSYYYLFRFKKVKILSDNQTIDKIINEKKSISRYGDGEFKWALGIEQESFQCSNKLLTKKLLKILKEKNDNLLLCIPMGLKDTKGYTEKTSIFWKKFVRWYGKKIKRIINKQYLYGNTNFTRWYLEYQSDDKNYFNKKIEQIKRIWYKKDIVIIEGAGTKIGVGNDLLNNAKTIKRIIVPSINAFDYYSDILKCIKNNVSKDKLILLALGPTATILASDLSKIGYQALDVGHVDIEYEWFKMGAKEKCVIQGKSVNEAGHIEKNYLNNSNKKYLESIIQVIGDINEN